VIELYYCWKKTAHYKQWKASYVPDDRDHPVEIKPEPKVEYLDDDNVDDVVN
jgi:hypothetical protein